MMFRIENSRSLVCSFGILELFPQLYEEVSEDGSNRGGVDTNYDVMLEHFKVYSFRYDGGQCPLPCPYFR